jgi:hypothetical protein
MDTNKVQPQKLVYVIIFFAAILLFTNVLKADFATPFVEVNNKIGDISEASGYVISLDPNIEECTNFLVIVLNDCMEYVSIKATATKKLITQSLLGRPVIIKAKVINRYEDPKTKKVTIKLEILSVLLRQK